MKVDIGKNAGKISVAVLGATGVVGQKVIAMLHSNAYLRVAELAASDMRVDCLFGDVCDWREPLMSMPDYVANMRLSRVGCLESKFVISCLPADVAAHIEPELAAADKLVFSNASALRMNEHVPLLIPEINYEHLALLNMQGTEGKIVTNPNCAVTGAALALAPLTSIAGLEHVSVVTLQSVSGAGYPGVSSLDMLCNTIPYIEGEADKIVRELKKILGSMDRPADFAVTASVHRVPVLYGHVATIHVMLDRDVDIADICRCYSIWNDKFPDLFMLHSVSGRPQSARDLPHDDMRVHIGHITYGGQNNIVSMVVLIHNLVRGAAGAAIANVESYLRFDGVL